MEDVDSHAYCVQSVLFALENGKEVVLGLFMVFILVGEGARGEEMEVSSAGAVGQNDLLIVGPGVLGRLVAERWREVWIQNLLYL